MGSLLLFLVLTTTAPDLGTLARDGATPEAIAAAWRDSGAGPLEVAQAVTYYGQGVPVAALELLLDDDGDGNPRVRALGARLEVNYRDFRIIGTPSASGPDLVVSGFDGKGERLKAAVIAAPAPEPEVAAREAAPPPRRTSSEAPTTPVEVPPPSPESFTERQPEVRTAVEFYEPFAVSTILVYAPFLPPRIPEPSPRSAKTVVDHVGEPALQLFNPFGSAAFDTMPGRR